MRLSNFLTPLLAIGATALPSRPKGKPAYFVLAGDSTTAPDGGWGDGFLSTAVRSPASGINLGHSGATTVSFRNGGDWAAVLDQVKTHTKTHDVFVTIQVSSHPIVPLSRKTSSRTKIDHKQTKQFGHNDQKPDKNISLAAFATNLRVFAQEILSLHATPILVSSLTRRSFTGTPPRIVENLANERNATITVAESLGTRWIDLNRASTDYVNSIGPEASWKYNYLPDDRTHLNEWGSVVFGRLVSDLLVEKYSDIKVWTKANETLSAALREGVPA